MTSSSLQEITALLAKKNSFMQAVQMLTELVTTTYRTSAEAARLPLFNACKRSFTLLCSRYVVISCAGGARRRSYKPPKEGSGTERPPEEDH